MNCTECQRRIAELGGADLLPSDVADHVATCAECTAALAAERHVRAVLAAAPWPESALAADLPRLRARVEAAEAAEAEDRVSVRARRRRAMWILVGVLAFLAAVVWLALRSGSALAAWPGLGLAAGLALLVGVGGAWAGLDVVGQRVNATGGSRSALLLLGIARAALAAVLVVGLLQPAVRSGFQDVLGQVTRRSAEAGSTAYEASLLCVSAEDGSRRMARWDEGCRAGEQPIQTGGGLISGAPTDLATVEYRAGTATIPAGGDGAVINFSRPMPTSGYSVALSPLGWERPIASDDTCRLPVVGAKSTTGFTIGLRRCWFESEDLPRDPVKGDLTLEWIAISTR